MYNSFLINKIFLIIFIFLLAEEKLGNFT